MHLLAARIAFVFVSFLASGVAVADCWRLPNGLVISTSAGSTAPVKGAQQIVCPAQQLGPNSLALAGKPTIGTTAGSMPIITPSKTPQLPQNPVPQAATAKSRPINASPGSNSFNVVGLVKEGYYHTGVDYPAPTGTPVMAVTSGRITALPMPGLETMDNHCMGNVVIVTHENGRQFYLYAHLSKISVKNGEMVKAGQVIGAVGDTGFNSGARPTCQANPKPGAHLHLELKDAPVLNNPRGSPEIWGYAPSSAIAFGYSDPTK